MSAIYQPEAVRPFFQALKRRRVDIVGIGDSNQVVGGDGWDHGIQHALSRRAPMYATGLVPPRENDGNGWATGYKYNIFADSSGASSGAPAALDTFRGPGGGHDYLYLTDGESASNSRGLILRTDCPIDITSNLTWVFHYGTFESGDGDGSFRPGVRRASGDCGWAGVAAAPQIDPVTGSYGVARVDLPSKVDDTKCPLSGGFGMTNTQAPQGPFIGYYSRAINDDRAAGFAMHNTMYAGGASVRDMAASLQDSSPDWAGFYFSQMRRVQMQTQAEPRVVVMINSGLNDRHETEPSVGPAEVVDGDSPEAFADNVQAIIDWFESLWQGNGWSVQELAFVVMPSHPVSAPDDSQLVSYRLAARDVADAHPRTAVVDLDALTDAGELEWHGWYRNGHSHLNESGFEAMGLRVVDALMSQPRHHRTSVSMATPI